MSEEWYKKHRPSNFSQVRGNDAAMMALERWIEEGSLPHAIMLTGSTGTGKTTVARILADRLGCDPRDYHEINAAKSRGIDEIRAISGDLNIMPWGKVAVWHLDECHHLTSDAQTALLKMLEDTPRHVYFFLPTTEPHKLKPTVKGRCTQIQMNPLNGGEMEKLLRDVAKKEGFKEVSSDLVDRIIEVAEGGSRKALVLLEQALRMDDEEEALAAVGEGGGKPEAFAICKAIANGNFKACVPILKSIEADQAEGVRRMILAYYTTVMLGTPSEGTFRIMRAFDKEYYATGKSALSMLVMSCWEACR